MVDGEMIPATDPVLLEENKTIRYLTPDSQNAETTALTRKYRPYKHLFGIWKEESINIKIVSEGGKFQGANRADFGDAVTLHTITEQADMRYKRVDFNPVGAFRYVRYLSADSGFCNIAELEFYTSGDIKLDGKVIGTDGHRQTKIFTIGETALYTREAAFDGNPLTHYYAAKPSGEWTGLDLGKAYPITHLWYAFLTDDHAIRAGDTYELFYFDKVQVKISLGKQTPQRGGERLIYNNVPQNALLYLKNLSRNAENRIFTYENNTQRWF